jgi:sugar lactone lactonase YvrE
MTDAETIVQGLGLIEGPVWREALGDLIITAIPQGRVLASMSTVARRRCSATSPAGRTAPIPAPTAG